MWGEGDPYLLIRRDGSVIEGQRLEVSLGPQAPLDTRAFRLVILILLLISCLRLGARKCHPNKRRAPSARNLVGFPGLRVL
jgi:hypothetical protein